MNLSFNINSQNQDLSSNEDDNTQMELETNDLYNHQPDFKLNSYLS